MVLHPFAALRVRLSSRPWAYEVVLFVMALLAYQMSRALVVGGPERAFRHALRVIGWEKASGLFIELDVQRFALSHADMIRVLNYLYLTAHYTVTPLFFIWLYRNRRPAYLYVRNGFLAANAIALSVYMAFPVAPPRLLTSQGFIDTLSRVSNVDLQAGRFAGWFNPYAAVPSMHFGYALMIGITVAVLVRSWPLRVVALAYPFLIFLAIVATANHYVVDSIGGALVMTLGFGLVGIAMSRRRDRPGMSRSGTNLAHRA
ncbi:MAG: phosphatase PAP2 family protein [Actinobacteria bacterium]|nr:phosphatase PAP2 family protein [Actinomycetota bacterium]